MKRALVLAVLFAFLFAGSAEAARKLTTTRMSEDGSVTNKTSQLIYVHCSPSEPGGYMEVQNSSYVKKFYCEHITNIVGPFDPSVGPVMTGIYADFYGPDGDDSHGVATFVYVELD
jgi:hypothetical protein